MLEVGVRKASGKYGLTIEEEKTHFALWAIAKAPLIIGADLRSIRSESLQILKNKDLIAVNQDPLSPQARCIEPNGCSGIIQAYFTSLSDGSKIVVVTNWGSQAVSDFTFQIS